MKLTLDRVDKPSNRKNVFFYDGFPLSVYEEIAARYSEVVHIVHSALEAYVNDDDLTSEDGSFFPSRRDLSGAYYIEREGYSIVNRREPVLYGIRISARLRKSGSAETDYLGLDIGLLYDGSQFTFQGDVDSTAL